MSWWSGTLSVEQRAIVDSLDQLCTKYVSAADCERWDAAKAYPFEAMEALANNGWAKLTVPSAYGGESASAGDLAIVHQALGRRSLAVAQAYYSLWVLGAEAINRLGTDDQKKSWLPRIASGTARIAFALTEPDSGSDASALRTRAQLEGDVFNVDGQKVFVTGALVADRIVTAVRTKIADRPQSGITLLMINPNLPGVSIRPLNKIGLRAIDLCEVFLENVKVPASEVLGTVDGAWGDLRSGLAQERLYLAAISVGAIFDLVGLVVEQAKSRMTFGKPIGAHQMIASKIVRMRVAADAAAGLVKEAALLVDDNDPAAPAAAAAAKLFATEAYVSGTREGVQIFGGYGFTEDYPVARHYRDAKYLEIGGGTSEMQIIVLARSMGLPV